MKKLNPSTIGLLQALGVAIYCALIVSVMNYFGKVFFAPPGFLGSLLILMLLVFSAGITGSVVFGYAAYLAFHKRVKEALVILGFTALYSLAIIIFVLVLISAFS